MKEGGSINRFYSFVGFILGCVLVLGLTYIWARHFFLEGLFIFAGLSFLGMIGLFSRVAFDELDSARKSRGLRRLLWAVGLFLFFLLWFVLYAFVRAYFSG